MNYTQGSMQTAQTRVEVVNAFMMQFVFGNQLVFFGLVIAEFALVIGLSAAINRISGGTASLLFAVYSALNGVTLAAIFAIYAKAAIMALPPFDGVTGHFDFVDDGNPVKSLFITRVTDGSTHLQTIKMPPPEPCHP